MPVRPSPMNETSVRREARDRAVKALVLSYEGRSFCHDLLREWQSADPLSPADAALAAELTIGVSRHRLTCEHIAARFYRGRWLGIRVPLRVILAMGVYQLCWLDRIPDHAVVDQAVRQAKRHGRGAASRVNALLRKVAECRGDVIERAGDPDPRRYLPIDTRTGRLFNDNIFPDPTRRPLDYLVAATSHPPWLVERWHRRFKPSLCRQVCGAGIRRPRLTLRPNTTRITAAELVDRLVSAGHEATLGDDGDAVLLPADTSAGKVPEIAAGLCQPQDITSQRALRLGPPQPGEIVLDLCAGAGTKSTQAAEIMHDNGMVIATDANEKKLGRIVAVSQRLGLNIIQPIPLDRLAETLAAAGKPPDLILVDAPCLNTGVLARRPEARYRAGARALKSIVEIQRDILEQAQSLAGPGTRILYATCSLEEEENEQQVDWFCKNFPDWCSAEQSFILPDDLHDGGFAAVLTRKGRI